MVNIGSSLASFSLMFTLVTVFIIVVGVGIIIACIAKAVHSAKSISNTVFGTSDIGQISDMLEEEASSTPKSVSSMLSLYLPMIHKDFPDLNWDEFREYSLNFLRKELSGIYDSFIIHKTGLYRYIKVNGTCTIVLQSAVEYTADGKKVQTRYNTHMTYVQNAEVIGDASSYSTTCPNCGAPITTLGNMRCEYCSSIVTPINIKVWKLLKIEQC